LAGGTGCSSTGELGGFALLALAAMTLLRRRRVAARVATVAVTLAASASLAQVALVQGFDGQGYDPSYAGDRFFAAPDAVVTGHLLPAAKLTFDYAYEPLRIVTPVGQLIPNGVLVRDQLYFHLDLSLALFERLRVDVGLPLAVVQSGDAQTPGGTGVQGGRLGDLRLGLRGSLFETTNGAFALGLQGDLWLPSGSTADFTGAGVVRGHLRVLASGRLHERFIYSAALGTMIAPRRDVGLTEVGTSITWSLGAAMLFTDGALQVGPELFGSTVLVTGATPVELLLGAKYRYKDFAFGAGLGTGLSGAPTAAQVRALVNVAWEPQPRSK
jgi:MYXO-CTERM domain-containing protein